MRHSFQLKAVLLCTIALLFSSALFAQMAAKTTKPIPSPRDSVSGMIDSAKITINYGSPSVRGRVIWGKLEPFDTVYRAGANEATRFTNSAPITVEGVVLPAGTYGFFVIPRAKGPWTVIFNSVAYQWGAFKYDQSKDVLRVEVKPKTTAKHERMIYTIKGNGFSMIWDTLDLHVKAK